MNHRSLYYDIIIIDSGVKRNHKLVEEKDIYGVSIRADGQNTILENDYVDEYGHGTVMYSIISKEAPEARILNIKIAFKNTSVDATDNLISALKYIYENIQCKVINISMGVRSSYHRTALEMICRKIVNDGIVIVSAFDNEGCISFPAAFDCVIGVDSSNSVKSIREYEYIENSVVNVCGKGNTQRISWDNPSYIFVSGNSVACAHISAIVFNLFRDDNIEYNKALAKLKENAEKTISIPIIHKKGLPDDYFGIKHAALFPFNKEMHALIRFQQFLNFKIESVHDVKYSGRVGASCNKLIGLTEGSDDYIIQDIDKISWSKIDTLILGHCAKLDHLMRTDVREHLILEAIKQGVNIYSYENIHYNNECGNNVNIKMYWPQLRLENVPLGNQNKLYHIDKPVLAIMGTSSAQGKFTLQNMLRQNMEDKGYTVGTISTEPNGYLLGMDYVFAIGYEADIEIGDHQKIQIVNKMLYDLSEKKDLIIAAGQANSLPFSSYMLDRIPVKQNAFILGLNPDLIILCVNPFDNKTYIENTIKYLEGAGQCRVCGLALFPMDYKSEWLETNGHKHIMNKYDIYSFCDMAKKDFSRPCYSIFDNLDVAKMTDMIIDELSD